MADGFASTHPKTQQKLEALGLPSEAVVQGYGYAAASAGFHSPVGTVDGHPWSPCVDLSPEYVSYDREWLSRLVDAGIAPFARNAENGWSGGEHWHCIDVALGHLLVGVETQVHDFCNGRNGLAGHDEWEGPLGPDASQQQSIREVYLSGDTRTPVIVRDTEGVEIPCYGFEEENVARVEARALVEHCGGTIRSATEYEIGGASVNFASANPAVSGEFLRVDLREMATLLGLLVNVGEVPGGMEVRLVRAGGGASPVGG